MTKQDIKKAIKKLASEENLTFIKAASAFQFAAFKMGKEEIVEVIAELKEESDEYKTIINQ